MKRLVNRKIAPSLFAMKCFFVKSKGGKELARGPFIIFVNG